MSSRHQVIRIRRVDMETHTLRFSLREICEREKIPVDHILDLVAYGIVEPQHAEAPPPQWLFDGDDLFRIKRALRLMRDLNVNTPGVAVASELLDELDQLRSEVARLRARLRH